jgi:hypothetical protein
VFDLAGGQLDLLLSIEAPIAFKELFAGANNAVSTIVIATRTRLRPRNLTTGRVVVA